MFGAVDQAISDFGNLHVNVPISDLNMEFGDMEDIDLTNTFVDPNGNEITISIANNSNPDVVSVNLAGNTLSVTALDVMGTATIELEATAGEQTTAESFNVTVINPNTAEYPVAIDDSPEQQPYPNNANPYSNSLADLEWTSFEIAEEEDQEIVTINLECDWLSVDYPGEGELYLKSPAGTEILLYTGSEEGTVVPLDLLITDFAAETMNGDWELYVVDSYGDGGHQVTNATLTINYAVEVSTDDNIVEAKTLTNYPNPYYVSKANRNQGVTISYKMNSEIPSSINIFNVKGQLVKSIKNENSNIGINTVTWTGKDTNNNNVKSGVYFYQLNSKDKVEFNKLILINQ